MEDAIERKREMSLTPLVAPLVEKDDRLYGMGGHDSVDGGNGDRIIDSSAKTDADGQAIPNTLSFGPGITADMSLEHSSGGDVLRLRISAEDSGDTHSLVLNANEHLWRVAA